MKFTDLNLNEQLLEAISYMGFEEATPVQEKVIPEILKNKDVIACAQTGTGKTAAFLLPVLHKLALSSRKGINTLIIVPTRELAIQINQQIEGIGYMMNAGSIAIYGGGTGESFEQQKVALTDGTDIIVATPGKLISHINLGYVNFKDIQHLVLDEADRMLDMGFFDDLQKIIKALPKKRQTLMFSATMPNAIKTLAKTILYKPLEISIAISKPAEGIVQAVYLVYDNQKNILINSLIADKPDCTNILIFSSTKKQVFEIARELGGKSKSVEGISSDLNQREREAVLSRFQAKKIRVLVATDVLSRGIDIKGIDLVINYNVPDEPEDYVHRIGRTARADETGVAITLVNGKDMIKMSLIEKFLEKPVIRIPLPEYLGKSPKWDISEKSYPKRKFKYKRNDNRKSKRS